MTTIIITAFIFALTIKVIQQGIRINGYEDEENSREIEAWQRQAEFIAKQMPEGFDVNAEVYKNGKIGELEIHPWINGDPCRCPECTDRYHKEIIKK